MDKPHQTRAIDRWLKYVAIFGPMVSGLVFGGAGYVAGFQNARDQIVVLHKRQDLYDGWKEKQDDFNRNIIVAIAQLQEIVKRIK